jgi:hypothetical protein
MHQRLDHEPCARHPKNRHQPHRVCYAVNVCRAPATLIKVDGAPRLGADQEPVRQDLVPARQPAGSVGGGGSLKDPARGWRQEIWPVQPLGHIWGATLWVLSEAPCDGYGVRRTSVRSSRSWDPPAAGQAPGRAIGAARRRASITTPRTSSTATWYAREPRGEVGSRAKSRRCARGMAWR